MSDWQAPGELKLSRKENFRRILRRFLNNNYIFDNWLESLGIVRAAKDIAYRLWLDGLPQDTFQDDIDIDELRHQLKHLDVYGKFNWEEK